MLVLNINNDYHICGMCNEGMKISSFFFTMSFVFLYIERTRMVVDSRSPEWLT